MNTPSQLPLQLIENTAPTMQGKAGNAWLIDMEACARRRGLVGDPRFAVTLPCWIASAPYAHPMWSRYAILSVALREAPGVPQAKVNLDGATHEVMVYALNPDKAPAVDDLPSILHPANFTGQFVAPDDLAAAARVQQAVQDVIDGALNPDSDYLHVWAARFSNSNLLATALTPDLIAVAPGAGMVVHGMGASNIRNLQQIVNTAATMGADETNPQ